MVEEFWTRLEYSAVTDSREMDHLLDETRGLHDRAKHGRPAHRERTPIHVISTAARSSSFHQLHPQL